VTVSAGQGHITGVRPACASRSPLPAHLARSP
jgi:hypothetical protein